MLFKLFLADHLKKANWIYGSLEANAQYLCSFSVFTLSQCWLSKIITWDTVFAIIWFLLAEQYYVSKQDSTDVKMTQFTALTSGTVIIFVTSVNRFLGLSGTHWHKSLWQFWLWEKISWYRKWTVMWLTGASHFLWLTPESPLGSECDSSSRKSGKYGMKQ